MVLGCPGVEALPIVSLAPSFAWAGASWVTLHGDEISDLLACARSARRAHCLAEAQIHRWLPDSGWVTIPLTSEQPVADVIDLPRSAYNRAKRARDRRRLALRG